MTVHSTNKKGEQRMQSNIYVDPAIDLYGDEDVEILIEFKIRPAKVALAIEEPDLTIEQAVAQVEASHQTFQQELKSLDDKQIEYFIIHIYKDAFNGISMKIQGISVKHLLESTVIKAIYKNKKVGLPKKPSNTMYQI